ncbi:MULTISPECIES: hypothetical protein [Alphaproteobacteria]|nr:MULTISPECIES: hypothetical protein [Alphaproteobacteria]GLR23966.1 hypothetical protein GCM10007920_37600 [Ciceribacter naphthalenivorans]GLT06822.1 hypothetical protein GCM10007926_37600 [Sphingomonas psychrolutea]
MNRALIASTIFFLALFALGFALGTVRVIFIAPRVGQLAAVAAEVPIMVIAGFFACRWTLKHCRVPGTLVIRWVMAAWFLGLLFAFETVLGAALFGLTAAEQLAALMTPTGLLGLSAQIIAALFPLVVDRKLALV